jgi:hypothetical protein
VAVLAKRERKTARALLRAEKSTLRRLRTSVANANNALVAAVATAPVGRAATIASTHVRANLPQLSIALHRDIVAASKGARKAGRAGLPSGDDASYFDEDADAEDEAAGASSGSSLASAWAVGAVATITSWDGEGSLAQQVAGVRRAVDYRVQRTAATETARAFNDERGALIDELGDPVRALDDIQSDDRPSGPQIKGDPYRTAPDTSAQDDEIEATDEDPRVYKVWSAILDRRTCAVCGSLDGMTVPAGKPFMETADPPIHPLCRCIIDYVAISALEDEQAFLRDLRAAIQGSRAITRVA